MRHLPNTLTCLNLFCGCLAVVFISRNELTVASFVVMVAAVVDFLDGFVARLLGAYSVLGKELDSLADMVTFGLVPGYMLFQMMANSTDLFLLKNQWIVFIPFLITIFSALRLAKFNIDERQAEGFIGLPTPATTLFIISIPLIMEHPVEAIQEIIGSPVFFIVISAIFSFLMVSEIPMFSLKFKQFGWKKNEIRYLFLVISGLMLVMLNFLALPLAILLYIAISVVTHMAAASKK